MTKMTTVIAHRCMTSLISSFDYISHAQITMVKRDIGVCFISMIYQVPVLKMRVTKNKNITPVL
jgi:hypothetical protein